MTPELETLCTVGIHVSLKKSALTPLRVVLISALLICVVAVGSRARAQSLLEGFEESTVFSGLAQPTVIAFSPDGRVFVAEKSGLIKVFDSIADTTPTIFADLRTKVHNFWDRGLLGLALDPDFPGRPYVYVLYTYNAPIGGTAPSWPSEGCPTPPGATGDGCVVSGRLSRLVANGNVATGPEQVLIEDWCQQYPSHSIGSLVFGRDGALYVSGGDGASFNFADYGQDGSPRNPCGDPPVPVGGVQQPPGAEGGALRSQSLERVAGPTVLGGAILRVDPDTGAGLSDNPLAASPDANARRIVAYGTRNPFRITARPGTDEIWVGDVGWGTWEEINRFTPSTTEVPNFGWPCYEGGAALGAYGALGLGICDRLYAGGAVTGPYFAYSHSEDVASPDPCPTGSSSISGLAFYTGGNYPPEYDGALFFSDYSRNCIWVKFDPTSTSTSLVLALPLNEGTGTNAADVSGYGHPGILVGAGWSPAGKYGASLSLNGSSGYVRVNGVALPAGDYTYEAWIRPSRVNVYQTIIEGGNGVIEMSLDATGRLIVYSNHVLTLTSASVVPVNAWTHVALTRSGSIITVFVNGVADPNGSADGAVLDHGGCPLLIGVDTDSGCAGALNGHFQGQIDEVRVYDRALTAADIQQDMSTPLSPGAPGPTETLTFVSAAAGPVDLKIGPGGDLYYADLNSGTIRRIRYTAGGVNQPPTAIATATPTSGAAPLTVQFDGSTSTDPDAGDTIVSYEWDLDGDGQFDDAAAPQAQYTYSSSGVHTARLRVTDSQGLPGVSAPLAITVGSAPTAFIDAPSGTFTWRVGDLVSFSGHAVDGDGLPLPPSALTWQLILHHCPSNCHTHTLQNFSGVASGSFNAPDHEYPSHLELVLTATGPGGLQDQKSVLIYPQVVTLTFESSPPGLQLAVGSHTGAAPFDRTVIAGSTNSISAPTPQSLGGVTYTFASWSDGGAQSHNIVATSAATYVATYSAPAPDTISPNVSVTSPTAGATVAGNVTVTATATDNVGVVGVQFLVDGAALGAEDTTAPYSVSWPTASVANGAHQLTARARDAAGNQTTSAAVGVTVDNPSVIPGLVAGYAFNEGGGTTTADRSGNNLSGTLSGAAWTTQGKFGGALSFDGVNDWVTVPDAAVLDLTTGMTLEAWVYPTAGGGGPVWRNVMIKERSGGEIYNLYSANGSNDPVVYVVRAAQPDVALDATGTASLPLSTWTHLAATYDGTTLRLYVNGVQAGSRAVSGAVLTSTGVLRIGGNSIWGEYFQGRIDEVRIYNRALSVIEIQTDMATP